MLSRKKYKLNTSTFQKDTFGIILKVIMSGQETKLVSCAQETFITLF